MLGLLAAVFVALLAVVYLATPVFAIVAWRRTRRIAELERRLVDAERQLQLQASIDQGVQSRDVEPMMADGAADVWRREPAATGFDDGAFGAPGPVTPRPSEPPPLPERVWELSDEPGRPAVRPSSGWPESAPTPEAGSRPRFEAGAYDGPWDRSPVASGRRPRAAADSIWRAFNAAWEEGVGGSVLAKLGAVLVVIGVALFVGWSMLHVGPVGRVAIAVAASGALLVAGLACQRRPDYRSVATGLSAAGWGGLYVTAFAMHGLEAARVIDDPVVACGLLLAVAAGMIGHAVWLGRPTLVAVAYAAAFAALAIGPASTFTAVACLVLAATLLAVAARFEWMPLAVGGLVCTYGILVFRSPAGEPLPGLAGLTIGAGLLWACWLLFEAFDIFMAARGRGRTDAGSVVMPLNLAGRLGVSLLLWPDDVQGLDLFLATLALAYVASTLCRVVVSRLFPGATGAGPVSTLFPGGYEATTTIATVLLAAALMLRFQAGWRLHVGLLLEAEFLFLCGVLFGQRYLRMLAAGVFALALLRFIAIDVPAGGTVAYRGLTLMAWTPSALLAAAVLGVNRAFLEWTDRRPLLALEKAASYAVTGLVTLVVGGELWYAHNGLAPEMLGVAWLGLAWGLLHLAARLRSVHLYWQCLLVACAALVPLVVINAFPFPPLLPFLTAGSGLGTWIWLLPASVMLHALVWQAARQDWLAGVEPPVADTAAVGLLAATVLTLVLLWHALPAPLVALGWAGFAVLALQLGLRAPHAGLRWHACLAIGLAVGRLFLANFTNTGATAFVSHRVLTVVPVVVVLYDFASRLTDRRLRPLVGPDMRMFGGVCFWAGTTLLVVLLRFELGRVLAVVGWAVLGLALLVLGRGRRAIQFRWQSHAIALLTFVRSVGTSFSMPEAAGGLLQPAVLGGLVVGSLFAGELLCPPDGGVARPLTGVARLLAWLDAHRRTFYAVLATVLLAVLLVHEVPASLLTAALGIAGACLLVAGFVRPDRSLRTCGLAVLGICVPKLFFWDLRNLETPYRILSFLLLGILLMAASWFYARFKQRLRTIP